MRILHTILILLIALSTFGQVAIIQDKDGFTNVRKAPNTQSEIIFKILENKVFWYDYEENVDEGDWISIYIPKNDYSFACSDQDYIVGFIHKSRLLPLSKMKPYNGLDFKFEYEVQPFDSTTRIIERNNNQWVSSIDGRPVWGTDGELPKSEIRTINVKVNNKQILINQAFYNNLFECNNKFNVTKNGDTYFVYQSNSDGAGYYELVWVITENGLKQRLVGRMF